MATRFSLTRSIQLQPVCIFPKHLKNPNSCFLVKKHIKSHRSFKSYPCPLWSSSFSICLLHQKSTTHPVKPILSVRSLASSMAVSTNHNPLLTDFYFPPFDSIHADHVRPAIRTLLQKLEFELEELENTVEPTWSKLVEPLEGIVDRLAVVYGAVSHLKAVKDTAELRAAIEEVQPEKVAFELKLGQSKPIYNAFRAIRESDDWDKLNEARKRIVEAQLKEAVLNGVALEDDKREEFNKIEQVLYDYEDKINQAVFPGLQGGPHNHTITGLAVALKQATTPEYKAYQEQVLSNCATFAQTLTKDGYELVSGGTDNHLVLVNLKNKGIDGSRVEKVLEAVHIASNKNTVPGDVSAMVPGGIRMGTPALTSRGFIEEDFAKVADFFDAAVKIAVKIKAEAKGTKLKDFVATMQSSEFQSEIAKLRHNVEEYAKQFPTIGFEKETMKYKN